MPERHSPDQAIAVRDAPLADLHPRTLYRILALRVDVFVVEQGCVYRELDGRDLELSARLVWAERSDDILGTLRLLGEPDGARRIGRVATVASARGQGLAARLVQRALQLSATSDIVLDAQAHLAAWYARFGFVRSAPDFVEDGIAHTPMRRQG
ncbi:MAG: GNAT family N-acetyltransferase [Actinomycetota bacterium]|nr:GNAT family N-acetyltransferase [Actinomycetota bacterium]